MGARAINLAILLLLLGAACGDGGEPRAREDAGGGEASSAELQQIELALEQLDARISRLEETTDELVELLGDDAALLRDLDGLIEELRLQRALIGAAVDGFGDEPCEASTLEDCLGGDSELPAP